MKPDFSDGGADGETRDVTIYTAFPADPLSWPTPGRQGHS